MSKEKTILNYKSSYEATRIISTFISMIGWLAVVVGVASLVMGSRSDGVLEFSVGIAIALLGLTLILTGQITRAAVDNADANRKVLEILKFKENVEFEQGLKETETYAADKNYDEELLSAIRKGHFKRVKSALNNGANPYFKIEDGKTLYELAKERKNSAVIEAFQEFLK